MPHETGPPFGPVLNGTLVFVFYEYRPVNHAALASVALFGLVTTAHLVALLYFRAWHYFPFVLGGICETFGYYARHLSHFEPSTLGPWITQNPLILAAAPCIAASVYMSVGHMIGAAGAQRNRWLSKLYILLDTVVLFSQLVGTVMPASGDPDVISLSMKIILGGLIVQLVALAGFLYYTWNVCRRITGVNETSKVSLTKMITFIRAVEVGTALILVRSLVRMVEYIGGDGGYVIAHAAFIYAFDAALMWSVMVLLLVYHPGRLIKYLGSP